MVTSENNQADLNDGLAHHDDHDDDDALPEETPGFVPTNDREAATLVRALTDYENTPDELTDANLQQHLKLAKLRIYNEVDSNDFFSDSGLGQALIALAAIHAKLAVENYSVSGFTVGDQQIDVSGVRDADAAQLQIWAEMQADGLAESEFTSTYAPNNTANYGGANHDHGRPHGGH